MGLVETIGAFIKLITLILTYLFDKWKAQAAKDEAFQLGQALFLEAAGVSLEKMREALKKDSQDAGSIDDQMDGKK